MILTFSNDAMFWNKPKYPGRNDNTILYSSLWGNCLPTSDFKLPCGRLKLKTGVLPFTPNYFSAGVCSHLGRVPEIKYSLITLLQKRGRHTYHQHRGVKFSFCLARVLHSGSDNDSTYAAAFPSPGFRLIAVALLSFNKKRFGFSSPATAAMSWWEREAISKI